MRLIINADDLGYSEKVNECIFSLIERRRITSATVIANAPAIEEAARRIARCREASFGVHLNITEFSPLCRQPSLLPLLSDDGETFSGSARQIKLNEAIQQAVFDDRFAQIERAYELGIPVSHLDSHHHVHTEPRLFWTLKKVQRKFRIRKVRLTRNMYDSAEMIPLKRRAAKWAWNETLRHLYRTTTTDRFTSFSTFYRHVDDGTKLRGDIELMCHPGSSQYEDETALIDSSWRERLAPDASLVSYNQL